MRLSAHRPESDVLKAIDYYAFHPSINASSLFSVTEPMALASEIPGSAVYEQVLDLWYGVNADYNNPPAEEELMIAYQLYVTLYIVRNHIPRS